MSLPRRQRGFSLLELVAAFLVFALGFGALMQILSASLRNARLSAEYTQAALWAQSKLDSVGIGDKLKEGGSSGEFDAAYRWQLEITRYQPPDAAAAPTQTLQPVDLYRVDLTVSWGGAQSRREAHFTTLRAANPDPNAALGGGMPALLPRGGKGAP